MHCKHLLLAQATLQYHWQHISVLLDHPAIEHALDEIGTSEYFGQGVKFPKAQKITFSQFCSCVLSLHLSILSPSQGQILETAILICISFLPRTLSQRQGLEISFFPAINWLTCFRTNTFLTCASHRFLQSTLSAICAEEKVALQRNYAIGKQLLLFPPSCCWIWGGFITALAAARVWMTELERRSRKVLCKGQASRTRMTAWQHPQLGMQPPSTWARARQVQWPQPGPVTIRFPGKCIEMGQLQIKP